MFHYCPTRDTKKALGYRTQRYKEDTKIPDTNIKDNSLRGNVFCIIKSIQWKVLQVNTIVVAKTFPFWCLALYGLNMSMYLIVLIESE